MDRGPTNNKWPVGIDKYPGAVIRFDCLFLEDRVDNRLPEILFEPFGVWASGCRGSALTGYERDAMNPVGSTISVLDTDLRLAVRCKVGEELLKSDGGQPPGKPMGKSDRKRHEGRGLIACVPEDGRLISHRDPLYLLVGDVPFIEGVGRRGG